MRLSLGVVLLPIIFSSYSYSEIAKWVDENGVTHYGTPPPNIPIENVKTLSIRTDIPTKKQVPEIEEEFYLSFEECVSAKVKQDEARASELMFQAMIAVKCKMIIAGQSEEETKEKMLEHYQKQQQEREERERKMDEKRRVAEEKSRKAMERQLQRARDAEEEKWRRQQEALEEQREDLRSYTCEKQGRKLNCEKKFAWEK